MEWRGGGGEGEGKNTNRGRARGKEPEREGERESCIFRKYSRIGPQQVLISRPTAANKLALIGKDWQLGSFATATEL